MILTARLYVVRLASMRGEQAVAQTWVWQVLLLARRARRWNDLVAAYLELGHGCADRGRPRRARRIYLAALALCDARSVHPRVRAEVCMWLFRTARLSGQECEASEMAAQALASLRAAAGCCEPGLHLILEIARWKLQVGAFGEAMALLRPVAEQWDSPIAKLDAMLLLQQADDRGAREAGAPAVAMSPLVRRAH